MCSLRITEGEKDADVIERLGQPFISLYMVAGSGRSQLKILTPAKYLHQSVTEVKNV
jgi:hypothetical protein